VLLLASVIVDKERNGWLKIVLSEWDEAVGHRAPPFDDRTDHKALILVPDRTI
jgi:hypothetical protein